MELALFPTVEPWFHVKTSDGRLRALRDRHYSCERPGGRTVGPPGRRIGLVTESGDAGWLSHWPDADLVQHAFGDSWVCSLFRNEGERLSSELVTAAVAATRDIWLEIPAGGFLTFVDVEKVRRKRDPGRCFRKAGFEPVGYTKDRGLLALRLEPDLVAAA